MAGYKQNVVEFVVGGRLIPKVTAMAEFPTWKTDQGVYALDPQAAWTSPDGLVLAPDPRDPTRYVGIAPDGTKFSDRLPGNCPLPGDRLRLEVTNLLLHDPPEFGAGFEEWADRVCAVADAELDRRAEEYERRLAEDGFVRGDQVVPTKIEHLWKPYIPLGAPTLFAGDPGVGKSKASMAVAAGVTRGNYGRPPANVLIMSVEDDHSASIAPMLIKQGADMERVFMLPMEKAFTLDEEGFAKLDRALAEFSPLLVVIDPMTYFLGGKVDMHRANEVRAVMGELGKRAAKYDCSVMAIMHVNKGSQKALYRILGSIDFSASVRSAMIAGRLEDEPERGRVIFHVKTNSGREGEPLGYDLFEDPADPDGAPLFRWRQTDISKAEFEGGSKGGRPPTQNKFARQIITGLLADGPMDAAIVTKAVTAAGVSSRTLRRVREEIVDVQQEHPGGGGSRSMWSLRPVASEMPTTVTEMFEGLS